MTCRTRSRPLPWIGLFLLAQLFIPSISHAAGKSYQVKILENVSYRDGKGSDKIKHRLDLYLPAGGKAFPVLLFVHGGGWVEGSKDFAGIELLGKTYARAGVGVVAINYRLSPGVKHPEHVRDVARAVAWTYQEISKQGGNKNAIFLAGHSAGGHLVSLVTADGTYMKEQGYSTKIIKGVVSISGLYDLTGFASPQVFGNQAKQASPISHAREGLPPFLLLYADNELEGCGRKYVQTFCAVLQKKEVAAQAIEVPRSNHAAIFVSASMAGNGVSKAIYEFVLKHSAK